MRGRLTQFDWSEIILDLRRVGMSQQEIARAMGHAVGEAMIRQYLAGATPSHWRGEMLLALWEKKTGKDRDSARRAPVSLRPPAPRRRRSMGPVPTEPLAVLARSYGISVADLVQRINKEPTRQESRSETLPLPGFEK